MAALLPEQPGWLSLLRGVFLAQVQPQVLLCRAGWAVLVAGVVSPQGQDFALLAELHQVLQPAEVLLDAHFSIPLISLWMLSFPTH